MNLKEKLNAEQDNKMKKHAAEFAGEIEPELLQSAKKGYSGFSIPLEDREDAHILRNEVFQKYLGEMLEGCSVEIETTEYTYAITNRAFFKYKLVISW